MASLLLLLLLLPLLLLPLLLLPLLLLPLLLLVVLLPLLLRLLLHRRRRRTAYSYSCLRTQPSNDVVVARGEIDTRFSYCALNCLRLLDRMSKIDLPAAVRFIAACQVRPDRPRLARVAHLPP